MTCELRPFVFFLRHIHMGVLGTTVRRGSLLLAIDVMGTAGDSRLAANGARSGPRIQDLPPSRCLDWLQLPAPRSNEDVFVQVLGPQ